MKCIDSVIVTLRLSNGGKTIDMELPAFLPLEELNDKIAESLRAMSPAVFGAISGLGLARDGRSLDKSLNLAQSGIWDGSILDFTSDRGIGA